MKNLLAFLLIGLFALPQVIHADAVVQPVASATVAGASGIVTGASAVASGTWMAVKGISGILWAVSKGLYHGGSAVARGVGHMVHHAPKQPATDLPQS